MGQAKKRGTFEDRRNQSIELTASQNLKRKQQAQDIWDALTPEQKEEWHENHQRKLRKERRAMNMLLPLMIMGMGSHRF